VSTVARRRCGNEEEINSLNKTGMDLIEDDEVRIDRVNFSECEGK